MMRERKVRFLFHLGMLCALLIAIAAPLVSGLAASDQVRLTVDNRNPKQLQIYLSGPSYYSFKVAGEEKEIFAVNRGVYDYTITGCGRSAKGTLDLSVNKTLVMKECGTSSASLAKEPNRVDLGQILKVVKIKVENFATGNSLVILTGPSTYVFSLTEDASTSYTVAKGKYDVQVFACGGSYKTTFEATKGVKLNIRCP